MNKTVKTLLWAGAGRGGAGRREQRQSSRGPRHWATRSAAKGASGPATHGDVFYARQGKGPAVVLLHGIYAGASGYEWRKNFDSPLRALFNVYAPDWLGFGLSDKPRRRYTADAVHQSS